MATQRTKTAVETARDKIRDGKTRIEAIRATAGSAAPELEATAKEVEEALQDALNTVGQIIPEDSAWGSVAMRFARRVTSRVVSTHVVSKGP